MPRKGPFIHKLLKRLDRMDHAAVPIDRKRTQQALDLIENLESLDKVSRLTRVLSSQ